MWIICLDLQQALLDLDELILDSGSFKIRKHIPLANSGTKLSDDLSSKPSRTRAVERKAVPGAEEGV